jgi:hypothetical protein
MPRATVNVEGTKIDLKTCPGGFVTLRQLSFGQMLKRRDMAAKYMQEFAPGKNATNRITIDILNEVSRKYDFAHCIIDHNLEDDKGNKLDFANTMSLDVLDPRIAAEIEEEIDKLNLVDFDAENFTTPSESSLTQTGNGSQKEEDSLQTKTI